MPFKRILSVIVIMSIILSLTSCKDKEKNQIVKYDIAADPVNLDPQFTNDYPSSLVVFNMMEGLLRLNSEGKLIEGVSKNFEVTKNGLFYTFYLRNNAKWENGENVTAYDFVFAFKRLFDPQTNAPSKQNYYCIKNSKLYAQGKIKADDLGVRATDPFTFQIALEYKNSMFLQLLTNPAAMPCNEKFFNETKGKYGLEADKTLANGPFVLNSWAHDDYLALKRNKRYVSTREVIPAGVSFIVESKNSQYRFTTEQTDAFIFKNVDESMLKKYNIANYENTVWGIAFNLKNKTLKNKNVRKAFVNCFDSSTYADNLPTNYKVANAIIPESITFLDKKYRDYAGKNIIPAFNAKKAKEFLKQGKNELKINKIKNISIIAPENTDHLKIFAFLSQVWQKELDIYVSTKSLPADKYRDAIENKDYDLAIVDITASYNSPEAILSTFVDGSKNNHYNYKSVEFNKILNSANHSDNLENAANKYVNAEKLLIQDGIFIPMYYQEEFFAQRKSTKGLLYFSANKMIDFAEVRKK